MDQEGISSESKRLLLKRKACFVSCEQLVFVLFGTAYTFPGRFIWIQNFYYEVDELICGDSLRKAILPPASRTNPVSTFPKSTTMASAPFARLVASARASDRGKFTLPASIHTYKPSSYQKPVQLHHQRWL